MERTRHNQQGGRLLHQNYEQQSDPSAARHGQHQRGEGLAAPGGYLLRNPGVLTSYLIASADGVRSWMVMCSRDYTEGSPGVFRCQGVASNVG